MRGLCFAVLVVLFLLPLSCPLVLPRVTAALCVCFQTAVVFSGFASTLSSPLTSLTDASVAGLPKDDLHRQTKEVNELTTTVTDDLTKLADKKKTEIEAV